MAKDVEQSNTFNRDELRLQAFQERLAQIVVEYESKIADLRVEFTILAQERDALVQALNDSFEGIKEDPDAVQATETKAD